MPHFTVPTGQSTPNIHHLWPHFLHMLHCALYIPIPHCTVCSALAGEQVKHVQDCSNNLFYINDFRNYIRVRGLHLVFRVASLSQNRVNTSFPCSLSLRLFPGIQDTREELQNASILKRWSGWFGIFLLPSPWFADSFPRYLSEATSLRTKPRYFSPQRENMELTGRRQPSNSKQVCHTVYQSRNMLKHHVQKH